MKNIKRVLLVLACLLLLGSGTQLTLALGIEPGVVYDGKQEHFLFVNTQASDLFPDFKDVIPGDVLTQEITLRCQNITADTTVFLKARVDDGVGLPENITLAVYADGALISQGPADDTAGLTEYVKLKTFSTNGEAKLTAVLTVPTSIGNEISNVRKNVDWIFAVQVAGNSIDPDIPQTGDSSPIQLYFVLMCMSAVAIIALLVLQHKEKCKRY